MLCASIGSLLLVTAMFALWLHTWVTKSAKMVATAVLFACFWQPDSGVSESTNGIGGTPCRCGSETQLKLKSWILVDGDYSSPVPRHELLPRDNVTIFPLRVYLNSSWQDLSHAFFHAKSLQLLRAHPGMHKDKLKHSWRPFQAPGSEGRISSTLYRWS